MTVTNAVSSEVGGIVCLMEAAGLRAIVLNNPRAHTAPPGE